MTTRRLVALLTTVWVVLAPRPAAAVKIRVKGSASIEAVALPSSEGGVTVRGEVRDDIGAPIPDAAIVVSATGGAARPVVLPAPEACGPSDRPAPSANPARDAFTLSTDARGAFCVRTSAPLPPKLKVRFAGSKSHEARELEISVEADPSKLTRVVLSLEPPIAVIDLDKGSTALTASLRIERDPSGRAFLTAPSRREALSIFVEDERGKQLGEATTGGDGRARFQIESAALDNPGPGELRLRFEATGTLARASLTQPVIRRARVELRVAEPPAPADPEVGIPIEVAVTSTRGLVEGGIVEALRGDESVGAGRVAGGKATIVAAFSADRAGTVPLTLRYVASAPWWEPGPAIQVDVPIAGPGVARQLALAALVLFLATWVLAGWRRTPKRAPPVDGDSAAAPPSGRPGVQVLAASGLAGWRGHVVDAHDGTPIAGAVLRIVAPAFDGDGVIAETRTDERGGFVLEGGHRSDARLVVESELHSAYEQPLPQPSVLSVAIVTRRRALLDRLVRWAKKQGAPYDGLPEPTPGHVRRAAARGDAVEVEAWARRVEHAAYGPAKVGAADETQIRAAEPAPRRS